MIAPTYGWLSRNAMKKTKQLREWVGDFGDSYTDRKVVEWQNRLSAFEVMLAALHLDRF